jgi:predicted PurR-regulated permease PerM
MRQPNEFNVKALNIAIGLSIVIMLGWLLIVGKSLLVPIMLALVFWYLIDTVAERIQSIPFGERHIPHAFSLLGAFIVAIFFLMFVANMVASNAEELAKLAPSYTENIETKIQKFLSVVAPDKNFKLDQFNDILNLQQLVSWTTSLISNITSTMLLVWIYLLFIFLERSVFDLKFTAIFGTEQDNPQAFKVRNEIMSRIRTYLTVKTFVSLLTGVLSAAALALIGVDYPVFWGFIVFLFNYIPTIGSMLAVLFPAALALVQFDTSSEFFVVVLLLGGLQFLIGNLLEPKLMGSSLNLSGLVILISLAFWGSIWGITGMILSVPMTVVILIICSNFHSTRTIAILLSSKGEI